MTKKAEQPQSNLQTGLTKVLDIVEELDLQAEELARALAEYEASRIAADPDALAVLEADRQENR